MYLNNLDGYLHVSIKKYDIYCVKSFKTLNAMKWKDF